MVSEDRTIQKKLNKEYKLESKGSACMMRIQVTKDKSLLFEQTYNLDTLVIGSSKDKDFVQVCLDDSEIPILLASISKDSNGEYTFRVIASQSDLLINGKKSEASKLAVGDTLTINDFEIKILEFNTKNESPDQVATKRGTYLGNDKIKNLSTHFKSSKGNSIEVMLAWGERVLNTYHFKNKDKITIGNQKHNDIFLSFLKGKNIDCTFIDCTDGIKIAIPEFAEKVEKVENESATELTFDKEPLVFNKNELIRIHLGSNMSLLIRAAEEAPPIVMGPAFLFSNLEKLGVVAAFVIAFSLSAIVNLVTHEDIKEKEQAAKIRRIAKFIYKSNQGSGSNSAAGSSAKSVARLSKNGGAQKLNKTPSQSAETKVPDVSKMGVLGIFGSNGIRNKLDVTATGNGTLQGIAAKATGGAGESQNLAGDSVGTPFDNPNGNPSAKAIGIGDIGTNGTASGVLSGSGTAGRIGNKGSLSINVGGDEEGYQGQIDKEAIRRVISKNIRQVRACYENALNRQPDLAGKLVLQWEIGPGGRVLAAKTKLSTIASEMVAQCVISRLRTWTFPEPPPGVIGEVAYPFVFESTRNLTVKTKNLHSGG